MIQNDSAIMLISYQLACSCIFLKIQIAFVYMDLNLQLLPPRCCLGLKTWDLLLRDQNKHLFEQAWECARSGALHQNQIIRAFSGNRRFRHVLSKGEEKKKQEKITTFFLPPLWMQFVLSLTVSLWEISQNKIFCLVLNMAFDINFFCCHWENKIGSNISGEVQRTF